MNLQFNWETETHNATLPDLGQNYLRNSYIASDTNPFIQRIPGRSEFGKL